MPDPYEFSRRVRELADSAIGSAPLVARLRDLANDFDSRLARYEAEIAVLRAEVARAPQWSMQAPIAVPTTWPADSGTPPGARMTGGTAKPTT